MAAVVRGVSVLQNELEKAKESLKHVDDNIKRITGRDPTDQRPGPRRVTVMGDLRGRGRLFNQARRTITEGDGPPVRRQRMGGAFSRLGPRIPGRRGEDSAEEDDIPNKPAIQSSVIITPKDSRTRKDALTEESKDGKGNARNKRMFGLLLGTLKKFKVEAKEKQDKEEQRKEIEHKLEEKAKQEKEELQKERRQLFLDRRHRQAKVKMIEQKMEIAKIHEDWEIETKKLVNFIQTKAKPHIFYLPKMLNETLEKRIHDTTKVVEEMIVKRREKLENEIEDLMNSDQHGEDEEDQEEVGEGNDREGGERGSPSKSKPDKENRENRRRRTISGHELEHKHFDDRGSPQKRRRSDGNPDDHSGSKHRRLSKDDNDHKRRRRSDEGHRSRRRDSEGHRSSRRDREGHRSGRSDEKHAKRDVNKPEVKIDYEEEEGEVMNDEIVREEKDEEKEKMEVTTAEQNVEPPVVSNVTMPENGEEGEEGEVRDEVDE